MGHLWGNGGTLKESVARCQHCQHCPCASQGAGWALRVGTSASSPHPPSPVCPPHAELNVAFAMHEGVADHVVPCLLWLQSNGTLDIRELSKTLSVTKLSDLTMDRKYPQPPPPPSLPPEPRPPPPQPPLLRRPSKKVRRALPK